METAVYQLDSHTFLIDGYDLNMAKRTGSYVLTDPDSDRFTIIETGPSLSVPYIESGLKQLGLHTDQLDALIVTHVHLDHAGGAGLFVKDKPHVNVGVHPKGLKHLDNPDKLVKGARAVYGEEFDRLFEPVVPIDNSQLFEAADGNSISVGSNRKLTVIETPGHAAHHIALFDSLTLTMFTGDTLGIRYPELEEQDAPCFLPSTSPNQFDPEQMKASLAKIKTYHPERIAFGHFGVTDHLQRVEEELTRWLKIYTSLGKNCYQNGMTLEKFTEELQETVMAELAGYQVSGNTKRMIALDIQISAMGVYDWIRKTAE
ncbi:MBL fold metallo-hydrolase [Salisediminibacterium halotolerans]|uniref:Glyoxylase, beta-lactamase superfamily II n=1 Tax=Salisediminibacterium halotolerans TaxID=517425 RepID=A0A1H9NXZ6_9BACI|nr:MULTISPECIES: MBL fold metallo-hydrolase [Salisediminibacterium]RLJ77889.1 glyoxylase-like metal-dependent hydrolase (beta-lactamase superfamily II) [Actinophytocola xinjiangensis]RPE88773.1 glyoxylase-like metal-dependent hydrolase (beta-lactamase superfamily II) [Salisediminibacterium halotolerans]TWG36866.1 glyoxylase-like metal-dependent hydrolase (beta-lactamase superfamily II) [Salisediminibacterium halotolerans]SER40677.1 Glyoxylase, beta-lactamase superfamily II [Salisediminibacteriu